MLVNEHVDIINELTNTTTVDYEWGLVRATRENSHGQHHGRSGVPKNYLLTARVGVVQGTTMDPWDTISGDPLTIELRDALRSYERTYRGKYYLGDIRVSQFVRPYTTNSAESSPRPVLVDIEPRVNRQRLLTRFTGHTACPPSERQLWI